MPPLDFKNSHLYDFGPKQLKHFLRPSTSSNVVSSGPGVNGSAPPPKHALMWVKRFLWQSRMNSIFTRNDSFEIGKNLTDPSHDLVPTQAKCTLSGLSPLPVHLPLPAPPPEGVFISQLKSTSKRSRFLHVCATNAKANRPLLTQQA